MNEEEESKKAEFARIQPVKVQKSMTAEELEAHKMQLEQYYSGKNVAEIDEIVSTKITIKKSSKIRVFLSVLVFVFFWVGVLLSFYLKN